MDQPTIESPPRPRIRALDPLVVNKIAAGEIIIAPVHALKELIENAVDAKSEKLDILVKDGGLKLLQLTDDGVGIDKDDLSLLCQRHTTSKIATFEDLASIDTYGFRGEALASISHIAHLTVTTKTKESSLAWRAHYLDGQLAPSKPGLPAVPKGVAGNKGTQLTVEDLFYNVPTRRRAFRSPADEFNKIIDMVGRYAIHNDHVGFTCKKQGESSNALSIQKQATVTDRIRQIYGSNVANELISFKTEDKRWGFEVEGWVTNANYHIKRTTLLIFINHRSVESPAIKKAIDQTYVAYLPKGGHPFVYMSLKIEPSRVDVNISPTKREVHFLNEEEIVQAMCKEIETKLAAVDTSRTFMAQTLLPGATTPAPETPIRRGGAPSPEFMVTGKKHLQNPNSLNRTDASERKITSMFPYSDNSGAGPSDNGKGKGKATQNDDIPKLEPLKYEKVERQWVNCTLRSVKELRAEAREDTHDELTEIFSNSRFMGVVCDRRRLASIQSGVKLYVVDYGQACFDYFYQYGITHFGNFGVIDLQPALDIRQLLRPILEEEHAKSVTEPDWEIDAVIEKTTRQLIERREMLQEYFSFEVTPAGELATLPIMARGYIPSMNKIPQFLMKLGIKVNWKEEKACFKGFLLEMANYYIPEMLPRAPVPALGEPPETDVTESTKIRRAHVRWALEHVFFPAFKASLVATNRLNDRGAVIEAANVKSLYKTFERC